MWKWPISVGFLIFHHFILHMYIIVFCVLFSLASSYTCSYLSSQWVSKADICSPVGCQMFCFSISCLIGNFSICLWTDSHAPMSNQQQLQSGGTCTHSYVHSMDLTIVFLCGKLCQKHDMTSNEVPNCQQAVMHVESCCWIACAS